MKNLMMSEDLPTDNNNKPEAQDNKPLFFENQEENHNLRSEVPTFLKVLCILSLVNIVFGFFPALIGVFSDQTNAQVEFDQQISQINDMFSSFEELPGNFAQEMTDFLNAKKINLLLENSFLIMIFLLEGYGVWLMFKLKKKGFGLYVASQIGLIGLNIFIYPSSNIFTTATLFSLFFGSVLFVILYAINIKHMNN